ncbi:MAG: carbohydrate-binding domain-containing protein [Clostridiales bacterium]|nr:carbohydrate-binding domain-containing protein [Clostridiales bacterium]
MNKKIGILLVIVSLLATFALAACNPFTNPGDSLGGGGTGEVATAVNDTASSTVKAEIQAKSDLSSLAADTSEDGATKIEPTDDVVEISKGGTYLFEGNYGGIKLTKKELKVHFIFKNANFANSNGVAIDCQDKSDEEVIITLVEGTTNTVTNSGDDVNAIHVKGTLVINGKGALNVVSNSKSAVKAKKSISIVDATLNLTAANHAITGSSIIAADCKINVTAAGKDGMNAECDDYTKQDKFTDDGFVSLVNVNYTCNVAGDGIQANTAVYINGGTYNIKTVGDFVVKSAENMESYGLTADDFRYQKSGNTYRKVASDETRGTLYALSQGCKGIKVNEIEYTVKDDDGNKTDMTVYDADYLIAIDGGTFVIDSTDDAIHANSGNVIIGGGTYTISTLDDGITSDILTKITDGDIKITSSYEGIEGGYVEISGGTIDIVSTDDGINAASDDRNVAEHIIISGGDVTVNASGDGIDSNGNILISGGTVIVYGPTTGGDAGLDADKGIVITGGYVFATSTLGMVETPSTNSTQYVVSYAYQSTITAGSVISLLDSKGNTIFSVDILKNCQSIIFSTPDLVKGNKYSLYGGSTQLTSFTVSTIITTIGSAGNNFPGGMGPGGGSGGFGGPGGRR